MVPITKNSLLCSEKLWNLDDEAVTIKGRGSVDVKYTFGDHRIHKEIKYTFGDHRIHKEIKLYPKYPRKIRYQAKPHKRIKSPVHWSVGDPLVKLINEFYDALSEGALCTIAGTK